MLISILFRIAPLRVVVIPFVFPALVNRGQLLLEMGRLDAVVAEFALVARFSPRLIEALDSEMQARVAAAIITSPLGQRP